MAGGMERETHHKYGPKVMSDFPLLGFGAYGQIRFSERGVEEAEMHTGL